MEPVNRAVPPSERAKIEQRLEKERQARAEQAASALRHDFTRTFGSGPGRRVLQWLRDRCGHNRIILSANGQSGTIDPMMTTFAAMELNLYLEIRKYLPNDLLMEIENGNSIQPSGTLSSASGATVERTSRRRKRDPAADDAE